MGFFHTLDRGAYEEALRDLTDRKERRGSGEKRDLRFLNIEFGVSKFLILPPYSDKGFLSKKVYYHRNLPGATEKDAKVLCPDWTEKDRCCPICHVTRLLQESGSGANSKTLDKFFARARTYVNVIPLELGGKPVDPNTTPNLPHILMGPGALDEFLVERAKFSGDQEDFDGFFDISGKGCLPVRITKTKTGPDVFNVAYEFDFLPTRRKPFTTPEQLETVAKAMYDLDRIFRYSEAAWKLAVQFANRILSQGGFANLDPSEFPSFPEKYKKKEPSESKTGSSAPARTEGEAPVPLQNNPVVSTRSFTSDSPRDYTKIDPSTSLPTCMSWHNKSGVCAACPYEDACIADTAGRLASAAGAS